MKANRFSYPVFILLLFVAFSLSASQDSNQQSPDVDSKARLFSHSIAVSTFIANEIEGKSQENAIQRLESIINGEFQNDQIGALIGQRYLSQLNKLGVKKTVGGINRHLLNAIKELETMFAQIKDPVLKGHVGKIIGE